MSILSMTGQFHPEQRKPGEFFLLQEMEQIWEKMMSDPDRLTDL